MYKKIGLILSIFALFLPVYASAQVAMDNSGQIVTLYQQLIQLLQQELTLLQSNALSVSSATGPAPLSVTFTLHSSTGMEAVDYGDGHATGSGGCVKNSSGKCDLATPFVHTYTLPGTYTVTLYRTTSDKQVHTLMTTMITVTK